MPLTLALVNDKPSDRKRSGGMDVKRTDRKKESSTFLQQSS
jgi:hypothetical protein